jgi:hypothetical protein
LNSQNTKNDPVIKVTNTTDASYQTKVEASGTVRGVDVKGTNTTNVSTNKVTNTTEISAGKNVSTKRGTSVGVGAFVAVKNTASNNKTTTKTTAGEKTSLSYKPKPKVKVTFTARLGVSI